MTEKDKKQVILLRQRKVSYTDIANSLGLSKDAVKSFLYRYRSTVPKKACEMCGKPIDISSHKNQRFCSDICRTRWWDANQSRQKPFVGICVFCHKEFRMRKKNEKKYCSHNCYSLDRYKAGD